MTTATTTLTAFLLARLAEDESAAESALHLTQRAWWVDGPAERSGKWWVYATGEKFNDKSVAVHIARHDPARVLAEVEAKRAAIEAAWHAHEQIDHEWGMCQSRAQMDAKDDVPPVVAYLAAVYADHPDYRSE